MNRCKGSEKKPLRTLKPFERARVAEFDQGLKMSTPVSKFLSAGLSSAIYNNAVRVDVTHFMTQDSVATEIQDLN